MQLNHLHYFYEVARLRSFTQASRKLRVSQPSISKIVKTLEEQQGVKLFDRNSRREVRLTPTGQRFFESCERVFAEIEGLRSDLLRQGDECAGELAVGASDNLCNYLLPGMLSEFCAQYPGVSARIFGGTSTGIVSELIEGRIELGAFYTPVKDARLSVEELGSIEFWLIAPPGTAANKDALKRMAFVGSRRVDYNSPYPALRMLSELGIRPDPKHDRIVEANLQETQKRMVMKGMGYSLVPAHMVREEAERGLLEVISTRKRVSSPLYWVRKKGRTLSIPAEKFEEHFRTALKAAH